MEGYDGQEKPSGPGNIEKRLAEKRRAGGAADALCALHDSRVRGPGSEPRGGRAGARKDSRSVQVPYGCAARARTLAVPDGRRVDVAAMRLPCAAGVVDEGDRQSAGWHLALSAAGRPRHRLDEQAARL